MLLTLFKFCCYTVCCHTEGSGPDGQPTKKIKQVNVVAENVDEAYAGMRQAGYKLLNDLEPAMEPVLNAFWLETEEKSEIVLALSLYTFAVNDAFNVTTKRVSVIAGSIKQARERLNRTYQALGIYDSIDPDPATLLSVTPLNRAHVVSF